MNFVLFDCEKMVQALICAQDWLRPSTRIDMDDYFDELQNLEKGKSLTFHFFCNLFYSHVLTFSFFFIVTILDLGKANLKDNVIDLGHTLNI